MQQTFVLFKGCVVKTAKTKFGITLHMTRPEKS